MKKRQLLSAGLLLALACQGESPVVGESLGEPVGDNQGPSETGTTNQFIEQLRFGGIECLPRVLPVADGAPECVLTEVVLGPEQTGDCACDQPGRRPVSPKMNDIVATALHTQGFCSVEETCSNACVCEVLPASGDDLVACENDTDAEGTNGWCYVAPEQGLGNAELVASCPSSQQRQVRTLGTAMPPNDQVANFIACQGTERLATPAALGKACIPSDEYSPTWSNFGVTEVNVETGSPACSSGVCLINHFQGRVSCPYGQTEDAAQNEPACFVPGSGEPVQVPVDPQLVERRASSSSICSCRCDGPGPGPFCECPESMSCEPVFEDFGLEGQADVAGSYCIPKGTEFEVIERGGPVCRRSEENCEGDPEE